MLFLMGCFQSHTGLGAVEKSPEGLSGDPIIHLDATELFITDCEVGLARSGTITIASAGTDNLVIYKIERIGSDEIFYFEEQENLEFAPGVSDTYSISATLPDESPQEAELRITTNDVNARDVRIPVHAWPVGYVPPEDTGVDSGADSGG